MVYHPLALKYNERLRELVELREVVTKDIWGSRGERRDKLLDLRAAIDRELAEIDEWGPVRDKIKAVKDGR